MTRARNPRRVVLDAARKLKADATNIVSVWSVSGTVYSDAAGPRPRRADEYPENDARVWAETYRRLGRLIEDAKSAQQLAYRQHGRCLAAAEAAFVELHGHAPGDPHTAACPPAGIGMPEQRAPR